MQSNKSMLVVIALVCFSAVLFFQNCSDVAFTSKADAPAESTGNEDNGLPITNPADRGVLGGHFDLDTSTEVYALNGGSTNHHVHEYDDKHDTAIVDFFDLIDEKFDEIQEVIPPDTEFYIIVANSALSPKVKLLTNNTLMAVAQVEANTNRVKYALGDVAGSTKLVNFKAQMETDAILNKGLVPTQTNCVRSNKPGPNGEYRNGALVIQAVRADQIDQIDPVTKTAANSDALLWEATIFWHADNAPCL